jgi:hypothetical protein
LRAGCLADEEPAAAPSRHRQIGLPGGVDIYTSIFCEAVGADRQNPAFHRQLQQGLSSFQLDFDCRFDLGEAPAPLLVEFREVILACWIPRVNMIVFGQIRHIQASASRNF